MYWIRAYVKRSQIVQSSVIYVPPMVHDTHRRICEITQELTTALQRKPTLEEIAKFSNLKKEKVEQVIFAVKHQHCYSLDANLQSSAGSGHRSSASMNPDNKKTLYDLVACQAADVNEIELQEKRFLKDDLINFMKRYLSPQEVNLLLLRFGLIEEKYLPHRSLFGRSLTIGEVAQLVGLKPTKARRLINRSLSRLKSFIAHEWCPI
jgi:DNA-directed RNA polymerase sigma subunit (sigma70/sigma32)